MERKGKTKIEYPRERGTSHAFWGSRVHRRFYNLERASHERESFSQVPLTAFLITLFLSRSHR